jgi:hypothetical protein
MRSGINERYISATQMIWQESQVSHRCVSAYSWLERNARHKAEVQQYTVGDEYQGSVAFVNNCFFSVLPAPREPFSCEDDTLSIRRLLGLRSG